MGFCHNFQKQPTTNQNYNKNLLYISKNKTHKEILEILAQIQRNPKNKKNGKMEP
jgi:Txe/YoeB family toxin of Txe-Axe toxin-antitoxin module